jgi:hypothetical protein
MKAWLVLQEGPGAGYSYPLDPFRQTALSVGRSGDCDVTLADKRASRHHCDIRWNGRYWEVVDRGSTNGTYVNGMQVHRPYDLRLGDRVTIGETTAVLRDAGTQPATPPRQPQPIRKSGPTAEGPALRAPAPAPRQRARPAAAAEPSTGVWVAFWLMQGVAAAAVVCLAAGAFLPWLRVSGSLSQELEPMVQGIANLIASFSGESSIFSVTQEIGGLQGYGKLTLAVSIIALITLVIDVVMARKSVIPGVVYLVAGVMAGGAIAFDLVNYYRFYEDIQSLSLVFGVELADVVQVLDQFIDVQITPMIGLPLTGIGLVMLLVAGLGRVVVGLLDRG